jgi:hypothetical protein
MVPSPYYRITDAIRPSATGDQRFVVLFSAGDSLR